MGNITVPRMASREREGECGKEEGVGDPTMVSRCACQRQLKPPGGTTRSNIGVVESWWTCSCYILPDSGTAVWSRIPVRTQVGWYCSTLYSEVYVTQHTEHPRLSLCSTADQVVGSEAQSDRTTPLGGLYNLCGCTAWQTPWDRI